MRRYSSVFDVARTEVFQRPGRTYLDDNNDLQTEPPTILEGITGDLQIYKSRPLGQVDAPEGFTLEGAYRFSTKTTLNTMDEVSATGADTMERNGRVWYVWRQLAGGTGGPLSTDEYNDYLLVLEGLPNQGSPL